MDLYQDYLFKIQVVNIILLAYFEREVQQRFIETKYFELIMGI